MASNSKSNSSCSSTRDQIFANLNICFPSPANNFDIITATVGGFKTAWIIHSKKSTDSKDTPKAIMRGPPGLTHDEAIEGLLEATSVLVGQEMARVFEEFEGELSVMVGEGFVREDVLCGREMGSS